MLTATVTGGSIVSCVLVTEAVLQKYYLGSTYAPGLNAATAMFYAYVFFWASFIDNTTYVYVPEIWPTHLRSKGAAIAYCSYYGVAIATNSPASLAFQNIGYKYYFVFLGFCILSLIYIYLEFPEVRLHFGCGPFEHSQPVGTLLTSLQTARMTLEEVAEKFGDKVRVHLQDGIKATDGNEKEVASAEIESIQKGLEKR